MAELGVTVSAEVELEVGERTRAWLISMGWTPPQHEGLVENLGLVERLGSRGAAQDRTAAKARRIARAYRTAMDTRTRGAIDCLLAELGVEIKELDSAQNEGWAWLATEARHSKAQQLYNAIVTFDVNVQDDLNELLALVGVDLGELLRPTVIERPS
ncbi:hypothetical protein SEA_YARA_5 [Streptomyces phage Yara]|nr:hypothetical protein SEA_YARA_5 [Streptomyces phage Yara]